MMRRFIPIALAGLAWTLAGLPVSVVAAQQVVRPQAVVPPPNHDIDRPSVAPPQESANVAEEAGGQHLRFETEHGPLHLWRPTNYDSDKAGVVVYIHGYFTSVDQAWTDEQLAQQFAASRRNALFIAINAPESNEQDVVWKSLPELLRTVESLTADPLPSGPLVVMGHSGGFRTILLWLDEASVQYVDLLDGLYGGLPEFHRWLRSYPHGKPHRMVVVAIGTWRQASRLARHTPGSVRRRGMPATASTFTPLQRKARLLCIRSQYSHDEMVIGGKVIPILLQLSPIGAVTLPRPEKGKSASAGGL